MWFHKQRLDYFVVGFNVGTILFLGAFILAFLTKQAFEVPWSIVDLYLILLMFYATDKEIRRWRHKHTSAKHRGEYITIAWAAAIVLMVLIEIFGGAKRGYIVPSHMPLAVGGVIIIFFITQYLKSEYHRGYRC